MVCNVFTPCLVMGSYASYYMYIDFDADFLVLKHSQGFAPYMRIILDSYLLLLMFCAEYTTAYIIFWKSTRQSIYIACRNNDRKLCNYK